MTSCLQRSLVAPPTESEPELYVRSSGDVRIDDRGAHLGAGAVLSFDTSFGAFHTGRWKRLTSVRDVLARVVASGDGVAELVGVRNGREVVRGSARLGAEPVEIPVADLAASTDGVHYVRIRADGPVDVTRVEWRTSTVAERDVRLSLSITTFNRQDYVIPTVRSVLRAISEVPELGSTVRVLVVDNARNVDFGVGETDALTVVGNANLGGAGGFARGLMHLRDEGWATHVLFMDDDVRLETESLVRTVALFRHARNASLCVHGAMLSEERPWMQFEAGSKYRWRSLYPLRAIGREDDLRDRRLALSDAPEKKMAYTAWWYTAFPITITRDNPLPIFVRGDDVAFGLMHTGRHSVTLNGVVVWHADFGLKNNPSSLFYEKRNFAIIDALVFPGHRWWHLARRFVALSFRNLFSFRYASTEYMIRGMRAFLAGPAELARLDHTALHDDLRKVTEEKPGPLSAELAAVPLSRPRPKAIRLIGWALSVPLVGGFALPKFLRRPGIRTAPIDSRAVGLAVRYDTILYRHDRLPEGFVCSRDRERFFRLLGEVARVVVDLARSYRRLKREYRAAYPQLVSDAAWRERFSPVQPTR
jgi:glycosyltransferase involved in cell wall biosynthesis